MLRRVWQASMIGLARSERTKSLMQRNTATSALARRYVAGPEPADGVRRAEDLLRSAGIRSSLFFLGEYVDRPELVAANVAGKIAAAEALGRAGLDVHVSVDPTQIGHQLDPTLARRNTFAIAEVVARASERRPGVHGIMLDMEDQSVTDATIVLHDALRAAGLPVALTLQAYLRRTEGDLRDRIRQGAKVRLVKGAFVASADVALTRRSAIKANYRRLIDLMLSREAQDTGFYPSFATHDEELHAYAVERAEANGWRPGTYEFELLLGVRGNMAAALARSGQRVRLYIPFGCDWWPYAVRRIGESPRNAWLLARATLAMAR